MSSHEAYPNGHPKWFFGLFDLHCTHDVWYYLEAGFSKAHGPFAPDKDKEVKKYYYTYLAPTCCVCGKQETAITGHLLTEEEYLTRVENGSIVNNVSR